MYNIGQTIVLYGLTYKIDLWKSQNYAVLNFNKGNQIQIKLNFKILKYKSFKKQNNQTFLSHLTQTKFLKCSQSNLITFPNYLSTAFMN